MNLNKINFDIEGGFRYYLPNLFNLIEGDISWSSIVKRFDKEYSTLSKKYDNGEPVIIKVNIYSIIISAEKGEENGINLLFFINSLIGSLINHLDSRERRLIKTNIKHLLYFHEDFLNYLGELAVLDCCMKSGNYRLKATEYKEDKNGSIDFCFQNKSDGTTVLFEVINIELKEEKLTNNHDIEIFLKSKLEAKLKDTDEKSGISNYQLVPVLWGGKENVKNFLKIKHFYEQIGFPNLRVATPMVYFTYTISDKFYHKFCSILNVLNHDETLLSKPIRI